MGATAKDLQRNVFTGMPLLSNNRRLVKNIMVHSSNEILLKSLKMTSFLKIINNKYWEDIYKYKIEWKNSASK